MANTFKNKLTANVGTSPSTVYTTPASTTSTVIGVSVANVNTNNISVSVRVTDSSTATTAHIVKDALITPGGSLVAVGGEQKVVLEPNDTISVVSSIASSADVIVSVLEIS